MVNEKLLFEILKEISGVKSDYGCPHLRLLSVCKNHTEQEIQSTLDYALRERFIHINDEDINGERYLTTELGDKDLQRLNIIFAE